MSRDRIVIAGATGFVGSAFAQRLAKREDRRFQIVGLTRSRTGAPGAWDELVSCDLFSQTDVAEALRGARYAAYLVHSMLPSAKLVQGDFADLDLICADNFGRAAKEAGVEHIVYLGGLLPTDVDESDPAGAPPLSRHLASRLEVEQALAIHGVPVTVLRAGMVIGPGGSSFELMRRLVARVPVVVAPSWTQHRCQPIDLGTVVALLERALDDAIAAGPHDRSVAYDVGGPDILSYREMMAIVAEELGKPRRVLPVPWIPNFISRRAVSLLTGAPMALVAPLVESLRHDMVCRDRRLQVQADLPGLPFRDSVAWCLGAEQARADSTDPAASDSRPHAYRAAPSSPLTGVRSVQRIPLPQGRDAKWAAEEYIRWLPRGAWPLLHTSIDAQRTATFSLVLTKTPLLVLKFAPHRSTATRQLFYVKTGLLVRETKRGRLEFRVAPDGEHLLTAIHDFVPRLPWWIYVITQALVHRWVMWRFGRHLGRCPAVAPPAAPAVRAPELRTALAPGRR